MKISDRLFCFLLFDRMERNILITTPEYLKSLNIRKVDDIIIFNILYNEIDIFRILSRINKKKMLLKIFTLSMIQMIR